jgi:hypothetical protein
MKGTQLLDFPGKRKIEYFKDKISSLNQTVRIRISATCVGEKWI